MILRERTTDRFTSATNEQHFNDMNRENDVQIKEEILFPSNSFHGDSYQLDEPNNQINGNANSIDLMDISKCLSGIEGKNHEYESINCHNEKVTTDELKIEAIKKYLTDFPAEYIDFDALQTVKHEYFPTF